MTAPGRLVSPVVAVRDAGLALGGRWLWRHLDLEVAPGELVAVLGSNGAGKTSLLRALLGLVPLSEGSIEVLGEPARRGRRGVGYLPQGRTFPLHAPVRGRDLVAMGVSGRRWGMRGAGDTRVRVDELLRRVGAEHLAAERVGHLSGGELQRLRVAQAVADEPRLLVCDEPLQSLDPGHQQVVVDLVDGYRRASDAAVLFVTHDLTPVLPVVDRVLYVVDGRFRWGTVAEVMNSDALSALYDTHVEVIRRDDALVVLSGAHRLAAS